jgi:hypothetical protein
MLAQPGLRGGGVACLRLRAILSSTWVDVTRRCGVVPALVGSKGLLMRLGFAPFRGSNPRASAPDQGVCAKAQAPWLVLVIIFVRSWHIAGTTRERSCSCGERMPRSRSLRDQRLELGPAGIKGGESGPCLVERGVGPGLVCGWSAVGSHAVAGGVSRLAALGANLLFAYARRWLWGGGGLIMVADAHVASATCAGAGCQTPGRPDDSCAAVMVGASLVASVAGCWVSRQVPTIGCGAAV